MKISIKLQDGRIVNYSKRSETIELAKVKSKLKEITVDSFKTLTASEAGSKTSVADRLNTLSVMYSYYLPHTHTLEVRAMIFSLLLSREQQESPRS